ncbi:MAG: hypothetical protein DI586_01980 [Micavibrio aeruginosavorus]|uniref:Copper-binding protein n=1 Tax=Micavibrio aeruginosavorus TaxID=349221 RepID=A0A2W5HTI8_9BACT|nr:MAG: hypothetical protein DI586_01980 [Micavibrio aeruginosavorus]
MKKSIALTALAVLALTPSFAKAEDVVKHETTHETTTHTTTVEAKEAVLKDGTKISIEGDHVFVVSADGTKTPAPDAQHELADGTKVTTHGGVIVK